MTTTPRVVFMGGIRTPFVKAGTVFRKYSALDLGVHAVNGLIETQGLPPNSVDEAKDIAILAGIGAAGARAELLALSERLNAPIVRTLRAKDFIDENVEACIGGLGLLGGVPASDAMDSCDLLLIVGADYPYTSFYPKNAKIIQIEPAPARMGRRAAVAAPLRGHAKPTLDALLDRVNAKKSDQFFRSMQKAKRRWRSSQEKAEQSDATPIKPQRLVAEIAAAAPDDAIFICDTGTSTAWTARHLPVGEQQRYTLSSSLASMAFAMPGAIGAQLLYPDREVIAGDGGFAMLMADFITAIRYGLPRFRLRSKRHSRRRDRLC